MIGVKATRVPSGENVAPLPSGIGRGFSMPPAAGIRVGRPIRALQGARWAANSTFWPSGVQSRTWLS